MTPIDDEDISQAQAAGRAARHRGVEIGECPFDPSEAALRSAWCNGWLRADRESLCAEGAGL